MVDMAVGRILRSIRSTRGRDGRPTPPGLVEGSKGHHWGECNAHKMKSHRYIYDLAT